jgi:hypothetical protein
VHCPKLQADAAIVLPEVSKIALAQQLTALLHSPERIDLVAAACQQRAHQQFNLSTVLSINWMLLERSYYIE